MLDSMGPDGTAGALLAIETAGSNCSVAVARADAVLAEERRPLRHGHAEALFPMIERVMAEARLRPEHLVAVAAATGPGGFTGIRVGLAAAHGIALAVGARLIGITSFAAVAAGLAAAGDGETRLLVALDSRREDLYVQPFLLPAAPTREAGAAPLAAPQALLPQDLAAYVARHAGNGRLLIAGDAASVAAAALGPRATLTVAAASAADARGVAAAALPRLAEPRPDQPPRPLYLRPPDVTMPPRRRVGAAGAT